MTCARYVLENEREEIRTFEEPVHGLPDAMYYLFTDARGLDRVLCLEFRTTCNRRIGAAERSPLRVNIVGVRQTRAFLFCYLFSLISNPAPGASLYFVCFFFFVGMYTYRARDMGCRESAVFIYFINARAI